MIGIHRDTIMRLSVRIEQDCATLLDHKMLNLDCQRIELGRSLGYIGKKMAHVHEDDDPSDISRRQSNLFASLSLGLSTAFRSPVTR
jgi:hypothetical protein